MSSRADMPNFGRSGSVLTRPLCFVRCRVLQTCIEFHDRYFDADLGHGERVLLGQRGGNPVIASAREDGCTYALLFEDDVALDRSRCLILAEFYNPIRLVRAVSSLTTSNTTMGSSITVAFGLV